MRRASSQARACALLADRLRPDRGQGRQRDGRGLVRFARPSASPCATGGAAAVGRRRSRRRGRAPGLGRDSGRRRGRECRRSRTGRRGDEARWSRVTRRYGRPTPAYRRRLVLLAMARRQRVARRRGRHRRVLDLAEAIDQALPLVGLEDLVELLRDARRPGPVKRLEADVDVVVVVGHRVGVGAEVHQRDDLVGGHRSLQLHHVFDERLGDRARALVSEHRDAVDLGDVDRVARGVLGDVARGRVDGVAALQRGDGEPVALGDQVLHQRQDAAVDLARGDVLAAARVDLEPRVGEHALDQLRLRHQQHLADRGAVGERVLALGAVDRRRLEQLPAVEDRLRVDLRRAAPGGADLEVDPGRVGSTLPILPSTVPAVTFDPSSRRSSSIELRSKRRTPEK